MSEGLAPLQEALAALRSQGAWRLDPARFHFLEALARRLSAQPPPVQRLLEEKLQAGLAEYRQRVAQVQPAAPARPPMQRAPRKSDAACVPLAELNAYARSRAAPVPAAPVTVPEPDADELPSARRFRQAWDRGRTLERVAQAVARRPANAGPLNSHSLVLQSLALMRELSPDYLRHFLARVESLQWLEELGGRLPGETAKAGKGGKPARREKGRR